MKKLFVLILALGVIWVGKVYSVTAECTYGGSLSTCTDAYDADTYASNLSACGSAKQSIVDQEATLCGPQQPKIPDATTVITEAGTHFDTSVTKGRCKIDSSGYPESPAGRNGGVWGYFQQTCFSEQIPGSCFWKLDDGNYRFIHGKVVNRNACRRSHIGDWFCKRFSADTQKTPPSSASCESIVCLTGCKKSNPDCKILKADKFEERWVKKYEGWNNPVKGAKVKRHLKKGWHSGESSQLGTGTTDDIQADAEEDEDDGDIEVDQGRNVTCVDLCTKYWAVLDIVGTDKTGAVAAQASLDAMCPPCTNGNCVPPCDNNNNSECVCGQDGGQWINGNCQCIGNTGTTLDRCLCLTSGKDWIDGHCYPKGSSPLPGGYNTNHNNSGNVSSTDDTGAGNTDTGAGTSAGGGATTSGLGTGGLGDTSGAAGGAGAGGKGSWYDQLAAKTGTAAAGRGTAFGRVGATTPYATGRTGSGTTGGPGGAGKDELLPKVNDIFTEVSGLHNKAEGDNKLAAFTYKPPTGPPKKAQGSKPRVYK